MHHPLDHEFITALVVALKICKCNTRDDISELKSASSYKLFSLTLELAELEALEAVKAMALER